MRGLQLRKQLDRKHLVLLFVGVLLFRTGIQYLSYGLTGSWFLDNNDKTRFVLLTVGSPDSYGNQIFEVELLQDPGAGYFVSRGAWNTTNYTANNDIIGVEEQIARFKITVFLNYTLATSPTQAIEQTQVSLTVAGEFTRQTLTIDSVSLEGTDYYVLVYVYDWDRPSVGTYDCAIEFIANIPITISSSLDLNISTGVYIEYQQDGSIFWPVDGVDDFIYSPGWNFFDGLTSFSVDIQFKFPSWAPEDNRRLMIEGSGANDHVGGYINNANNKLYWTVGVGGGTSQTVSCDPLVAGSYYTITFRWANGEKVAMYVNGSAYYSAGNLSGTISSGGKPLVIGTNEDNNSDWFEGYIYHLGFYNRTITYDEHLDSFAYGQDYIIDTDYLVHFYTCEDLGNDLILYDGYIVTSNIEQWDLDFEAVLYSSFIFPLPVDYPELYIWLIAIGGLVLVTPIFIRKIQESGGENKAEMFMVFVLFLIITVSILVTGAGTL